MAERETSIRRGIDVLLALSSPEATDGRGLSVTRISELLGREKSQVSRSLKTLAEYGLVDRDPDTLAYCVGWRVFTLAALASQQRLLGYGERVLEQLSAALSEQAYLSVLHGNEAVVLLSKAPARSLQALTWIGRSYPAYTSAAGRALLYDHDQDTMSRLFADVEYSAGGPRHVRSLEEFMKRTVRDAERGYSLSDEEFEEGLLAIAAPVRDHRGRITAAVNISGPKFRLGHRIEEAIAAVTRAAADLSAAAARGDGGMAKESS
ncbi:IclR family transcriptional regulator [Mycolicibacterium sp. CH28]|uniref:IclR family transcriptional regulator n=1 Tax=Mycolicibacterium sp. CH28 TaxID=2512237 RepID=UPI001080FCAA|nr:IclR family transcriptional regulator [Mycolicibacterium sp. CH28]TGD87499.1 IclR family transcriptional regulator [Mycolicibacterium sp. CH28]